MMENPDRFDVIIVGGGLSGGLAALALARAGFSTALIDAQPPEAMTGAPFDGRTTALAYASARVFRRLGLWEEIAPSAEAILDILVTNGREKSRFSDGAVSPFQLHFDSRELKSGEPLGWIVENRALRRAIFKAIGKTPSIRLLAPAAAEAPGFGPALAGVSVAGRRIEAPLILAADGKLSALRRQAGIRVSQWFYAQTGIVATVSHARDHKGVAQELFLPAGPFAILPMTEQRSSLVWTERSDAAPAFLRLDDDGFRRAVADRFGDYLGEIDLAGPRWSYPLSFHLSHRFIAPRLALIGDAARAIHPIAGQGFNLGVKDIAALAQTLEEAAGLGLDIGDAGVLENYQRWRRFDSASLALGTDALNRLFSNDFAPVRLARGLGIAAVNRLSPLRRAFMRQAGADLGALPALMQAD